MKFVKSRNTCGAADRRADENNYREQEEIFFGVCKLCTKRWIQLLKTEVRSSHHSVPFLFFSKLQFHLKKTRGPGNIF